jgi:pyruvate formate lyase activating enzyme
MAAIPLKQILKARTVEGEIYDRLEGDRVRCYACGHRCLILPGLDGICRVRYNEGGRLMVPTGYVAALACDPTEKKPFFHAYPGSLALTFGMLGCDYHCGYCQNWLTSQSLRDPNAIAPPRDVTPEQLVEAARRYQARLVVSSYNEPLITSEWAVEVFKQAKPEGFVCGYVSNGNATPEVLDYIRPWTELYKIDLKGFNDRNYRKLGGLLENVLNTIKLVYERGFWLEVVTLIIPAFNDSDDELKAAADFIAGVSPDIPWHVTAFHQDYKMTAPDNTSVETLIRAAEIGYGAGLKFVYAGNLPGRVGRYENTYCPDCKAMLIERYGFRILKNRIRDGACPDCHAKIPGRWD